MLSRHPGSSSQHRENEVCGLGLDLPLQHFHSDTLPVPSGEGCQRRRDTESERNGEQEIEQSTAVLSNGSICNKSVASSCCCSPLLSKRCLHFSGKKRACQDGKMELSVNEMPHKHSRSLAFLARLTQVKHIAGFPFFNTQHFIGRKHHFKPVNRAGQ